ncbi:AbrB/MazE/SpoVT family DNA-binding domain-containing protein [Paracoccus tegillarcae]|uniref:AbrB family transcriptional regulator n=1 Tax=Paracoccus tegillarcae TaxID=1529068 RepID=A0A2K9EKN8_9RHOB|nr:AbrB/MazE/SpoVT family DNA-binding domain-containing protein [Paracoccus tegillarcae]AUH35603.1 AbrB family transcriptional regulator [Paracoccus tegillarcae]
MQIAKWGNSLAVRLPARMVQELGLKAGDEIEITAADAGLFEVHRRRDPEEILARLREFRGLMPKGYRFDRDEANAR